MDPVNRRLFLKAAPPAAWISALPESALGLEASGGRVVQEAAGSGAQSKAKDKIKFAVIGLDHYHIMGMTAAVQRGGGELVAVYATSQQALSDFHKRFGDIRVARSEDEI